MSKTKDKHEKEIDEEEEAQRNSIADQLIGFIRIDCDFFHDGDGIGYALIKRKNRREIYRIQSREFREYISHIAWEQLEKALSKTVKESILGTLEAIARFDGEKHDLHLRTAWHEGALWYDLGDWRAVKIASSGWEIVNQPPILFKRYHEGIQCEPIEGGKIEDVLQFINVEQEERYDESKILISTYLAAALIPNVPRPLFCLHGQQGSAKSTASAVIKSLLDPSEMEVMSMPSKKEELVQALSHHYCIFFDNLSRLSEEQSDTLCRACTGEVMTKRQLYSDDDDIVYSYRRVVGLNGINLVVGRPDLLDRSLIFELRPISKRERVASEEFWKKFNEIKPGILGAIFTALSKALELKENHDVEMPEHPRLADYARWGARVAVALGYPIDCFTEAYEENVHLQNDEVIENSAVAQAILGLVDEFNEPERGISFTPETLYYRLKACAGKLGFENDHDFPNSPRWLWKRIKIVLPSLATIGIEVKYYSKKRPREIEIIKKGQEKNDDKNNDGNDIDSPNHGKIGF